MVEFRRFVCIPCLYFDRAKAVLQFAERVARAPTQIVRYAYGGMPLWSASEPPKSDVPRCKCGQSVHRVHHLLLSQAQVFTVSLLLYSYVYTLITRISKW